MDDNRSFTIAEHGTIIAGSDEDMYFTVHKTTGSDPDLSQAGTNIIWVLSPHGQPETQTLKKTLSGNHIAYFGEGNNEFVVHIPAADTVNLSGEFTWQIIITDSTGNESRKCKGGVCIIPANNKS